MFRVDSVGARAMGSRWLARVYERWWGPGTFAITTGFRMPSADAEAALILNKIAGRPGPWLDLSCGPGNLTRRLIAHAEGRAVFALDRSPAMLERVEANAPTAVRVCADAAHLPFADGTFGAVVNIAAIDLYPDAARVVAESARVLAPGGRWVASTFVTPARRASRSMTVGRRIWHRLAGTHTPTEDCLVAHAKRAGLTHIHLVRFGRYVVAWADKA
jgi:ubiquinone/menaquinone biosynthesis C-methylase UbiE